MLVKIINNHRYINVKDVVRCTLSNVQKIFRSKSGKFAKDKREEAEHYFSKGKLPQAALCANISVARAPFPGVDKAVDQGLTLPLSLRTRCKIMFGSQDYKSALEDAQLALKHKLPDELKLEAYIVMSECYLKLCDKEKARISWTIVSKMAELVQNTELKTKADSVLSNMDEHLSPAKDDASIDAPELYEGESRAIPGTSSAMSMRRSKDKGRYMVANQTLPVGATLTSEEPYASVLKFDKQNNHCLHCYTRLKRVVPCPTCSGVAYCSAPCANAGQVYHQWECPFMELMIGSGMSVSAALSMRMITQSPIEYFIQLVDAIRNNDEHPHLKIYNLETHSQTREPKDFAYRTLMAILQLEIIRASGYFGAYGSIGFDGLTEAEMTVGCLLLRHLQLTQYNAHEVFESLVKKEKADWTVNDAKMNYVGLSLYPSSAYFNHDCQPTLARYFVGRTLVLRAERPIKAGEEVYENYGPNYLYKPTEDRRKILNARYRFHCSCVPCKENWPPLKTLPQNTATFRCADKQCKGAFKYEEGQVLADWTCSNCKKINKLEDQVSLRKAYQQDFDEGFRLLGERKTPEAESFLTKFVEETSELILQPNYHLTVAMEALRNCWSSHANFFLI
ncbi:hypothetical protein GE061_007445 [Apolygus lucorum]|uniref:SET domain-containing protein n=1 Tax=Apolygus lucorum TaxID=248454 RepID=A0A8S9WT92_APOLU|nr:hypothetical protein GE061_007445 [Apolygus lucorum]